MHRIDGAGHVDNKFVAEDAATNRPPTEITAEIMNTFQEELATFIEWAGLELAKDDNSQLRKALLAKFATLESPELVGNPKAPTPDQDSDVKSLVNIEFLRAALTALGLSGYARLGAAQEWTKGQRGAVVPLADAGTITPDFSLANNFSLTLAGNRTLAAPTNLVAGQSGVIAVSQDATGSRTLAFATGWVFSGGTPPSLTTTVGAVDLLAYYVETDARVFVSIAKSIA